MSHLARLVLIFALGLIVYLAWTSPLAEEGVLALEGPAPSSSRSEEAVESRNGTEESTLRELSAVPEDVSQVAPEAGATDPEPAVVIARFVDGAGLPVAGVSMTAQVGDGIVARGSPGDLGGQASLTLVLESEEPTDVLVRWKASGHADGHRSLKLTPGEERELGEVVLRAGALVSGQVRTAEGGPLPGARVWAEIFEGETGPIEAGFPGRAGGLRLFGPGGRRHPPRGAQSTDHDGAFGPLGLPVEEPLRLWAAHEDRMYTWIDLDPLAPDEHRSGIGLVLEPLPEELCISGRVLGPEGLPHSPSWVRYQVIEGSSTSSASVPVSASGDFRIVTAQDQPHHLTGLVPDGSLASAHLLGVEPGTHDLVLRLGEPDTTLYVTDLAGAVVDPFELTLVTLAPGVNSARTIPSAARPGPPGELAFSSPRMKFEVQVHAEGYAAGKAGPFEGGIVPGGRVEVSLATMPRVRGLVLAGDRLAVGAEVELRAYMPEDRLMKIGGFAVQVGFPVVRGTTDAEGNFDLAPTRPGLYRVVAHLPGWGLAEVDRVSLTPGQEPAFQTLHLTEPGTLDIRVVDGDRRARAGGNVALNRFDGRMTIHATDADGRVVVTGLTPGGWEVTRTTREPGSRPTGSSTQSLRPDQPSPWKVNCTVSPGRTTVFELRVD